MALYRDGKFEDHSWRRLEADELPGEGHVLLSLAEWRRFAAEQQNSNVAFGVVLEPGETAEMIAADLPRLALVAVSFPKYTDGRGYSTARSCATDTSSPANSAPSAISCSIKFSFMAAADSIHSKSRMP